MLIKRNSALVHYLILPEPSTMTMSIQRTLSMPFPLHVSTIEEEDGYINNTNNSDSQDSTKMLLLRQSVRESSSCESLEDESNSKVQFDEPPKVRRIQQRCVRYKFSQQDEPNNPESHNRKTNMRRRHTFSVRSSKNINENELGLISLEDIEMKSGDSPVAYRRGSIGDFMETDSRGALPHHLTHKQFKVQQEINRKMEDYQEKDRSKKRKPSKGKEVDVSKWNLSVILGIIFVMAFMIFLLNVYIY